MAPLRVLFFGSAPLACASLEALARRPEAFTLLGVVTQPDRPKGRALRLQPTPVKVVAARFGLEAWQPERCRDPQFLEQVRRLAPELIVAVAYGQILPPNLLAIPPCGCVNVHASLLPKYRGAAPIQWAILNDEPETGITLMQMDAGLDTGPILAQATTPIEPGDRAATLHDRLAALGADLLVRVLPDYGVGAVLPRPQPAEGATYARKIVKEDGRLDWTRPARELWNRVRAFDPWPGAFTDAPTSGGTLRLKVWRAEVEAEVSGPAGQVLRADRAGLAVACGHGALRLTEVQREGGRRLSAEGFLAGHRVSPGVRLGLGERS